MFPLIIFVTIAVLAIAYLSGRFTANYATERGRSRRIWFALGAVLFPLFPVPWMVLGVLPKK
jgi:hypothetical protein